MLQESNKRFSFSASLRGHAAAGHTCGRDKHGGKERGSAGQGLSRESRVCSAAPTAQGLSIPKRSSLGLLAAQPQQLRPAGEFMLQEPGCSRLLPLLAGAEQLGARSGLSLRASLEAELTRYAADSEPELHCSAGEARAQPLTCTISLQINLKFHIPVTSVGVQMTGWGPPGRRRRARIPRCRGCPPGCEPSPLPASPRTSIAPSPSPPRVLSAPAASPGPRPSRERGLPLVGGLLLPRVRRRRDQPRGPGQGRARTSKGRWCPLLSQERIGAAGSTSGTCHTRRAHGPRCPGLRVLGQG